MSEEQKPEEPTKIKDPVSDKRVFYFLGALFFLYCSWIATIRLMRLLDWVNKYHDKGPAEIGLIVGILFIFLFATVLLIYGLFVPLSPQDNTQKVLKTFVILACLATPLNFIAPDYIDFHPHRSTNHSDAKSNLHNLYLSCKAYWAEQGSDKDCRVGTVTVAEYGFVQSNRVNIEAQGTESTFTATAQHLDNENSYVMDLNGNITEKQ